MVPYTVKSENQPPQTMSSSKSRGASKGNTRSTKPRSDTSAGETSDSSVSDAGARMAAYVAAGVPQAGIDLVEKERRGVKKRAKDRRKKAREVANDRTNKAREEGFLKGKGQGLSIGFKDGMGVGFKNGVQHGEKEREELMKALQIAQQEQEDQRVIQLATMKKERVAPPKNVWDALAENPPLMKLPENIPGYEDAYVGTTYLDPTRAIFPTAVMCMSAAEFMALPIVSELVADMKSIKKNENDDNDDLVPLVNHLIPDWKDEFDVQMAVNNLFVNLRGFFRDNNFDLFDVLKQSTSHFAFLAEPDFHFLRRGQKDPVLVGEVKMPLYGAACSDLAQFWEHFEKGRVTLASAGGKVGPSPIGQTYNYLCFTGSHVAILTTYVNTWLFVRDCAGNLKIVQTFESSPAQTPHESQQDPPPSIYQALVLALQLSNGDVDRLLAEFKLTPCSEDACSQGHRLGNAQLRAYNKKRSYVANRNTKSGDASGAGSSSAPSRVVQPAGGGSASSGRRHGLFSSSRSSAATSTNTSSRSKPKSVASTHHRKQPSFADVDVNGPMVNQALVSALCDHSVEPEDIDYDRYNGSLMCEMTMRVRELVVGCPGAVLGMLSSKVMDLYRYPEAVESMQHEAAMFKQLEDLQGECIPRFRGIGHNPMHCFMYTLTVEKEGVPLDALEGGATEHVYELILDALRKMHERGVLYRRADFDISVRVLQSDDEGSTLVHLTDLSASRLIESGQEVSDKASDLELFSNWRHSHEFIDCNA